MIKKNIILVFLLLFVLSLNIHFRSFPIYFPQLKIQAKKMVDASIQQTVMQEVYKKFPQFYYSAKDAIVKSHVSEYKKQNRKVIKKQIQDLYLKMKDRYQDDSGQTYLMELDCWHWARYVENLLRLGHTGDEVIFGRQWDKLMLAPLGTYLRWDRLLYYISAFLYKLFTLFKAVPLFTVLFYLPLFFTSIFITSLYLFSFRFGGYISAVTSCIFVGLAPIFLQRSCAGWFDTDILNMLFPLLITWAYIEFTVQRKHRSKLLWLLLTSFLIGLFSFTWWCWWFILAILILSETLSLIRAIIVKFFYRKDKKWARIKPISYFAALVLSSLLWVLIISGSGPLVTLFNQIKGAIVLNKPLMESVWPNVFSTVGELRRMTFPEMYRSVGGIFIFYTALFCMAVLFMKALFGQVYSVFKRTAIMIFAVWFLSMMFASLRGVRFIVFLLIPLAMSLGVAMNELYKYFKNKNNRKGIVAVLIVLMILLGVCVNKGYNAAKNTYPLMDDTWYKVLNLINEKTNKDMIINSWWDFGDWFKVVGKRRVIFDGQSQDEPQAYWMAKAMLTSNENESLGILRMLNNGGNRAFEIINEYLNNQLLSVLLLEGAIGSSPEKAQAVLLKFLPEAVAQDVMRILFYTPPQAGFVVDYTMVYKMPAISYLGNWDFSKVYIAQNFNKIEKNQIVEYLKNLGQDDNLIQRFYQEVFLISTKNLDDWLSQRLQFYSALVNGREKDGIVYFDTGFSYNIKDKTVQVNAGQIPKSAFIQSGIDLVEISYAKPNVPFSVLIFETKEGYKSILLDRELGKSLFVRLYFLGGKGLKHFTSFIDAEEGNNNIRLLGIIW